MNKNTEYRVVSVDITLNTVEDFGKMVERQLRAGWKLYGHPFGTAASNGGGNMSKIFTDRKPIMGMHRLHQAMIKNKR